MGSTSRYTKRGSFSCCSAVFQARLCPANSCQLCQVSGCSYLSSLYGPCIKHQASQVYLGRVKHIPSYTYYLRCRSGICIEDLPKYDISQLRSITHTVLFLLGCGHLIDTCWQQASSCCLGLCGLTKTWPLHLSDVILGFTWASLQFGWPATELRTYTYSPWKCSCR